ncbi:hypothetical protein LOTGIDRAFT_163212 [Lottia gigantea]|uniref:Uncharacterized protein n=1 Tax=Lottia gigantea TaxID=225164 RepID=V3ZKL2_LOTGI|nr:hypothetical protein LOTGIDRAFT_163212 [Lottia gigantea]ESO91853.1 hypothetical protein LOTGIDRAFT_163212 [Lottia gigantea]
MELESRQQYMTNKQNELKVKLEQYNKCKKRWIRVDSVFKTLSVVLTVGTTVATAVTGGLSVPVLVPTVLATITAIQTSSCGLIAIGYTSKQKSHYKKKTEILNSYLKKLFIFFERSREDKNITIEEFNEILEKYEMEISAIKIYTHNNRNLRPTIVKEELDFCLIRRNKKVWVLKKIIMNKYGKRVETITQ